MFTRVSRFHCPPESARICSKTSKQYQIAVSDLSLSLPNSTTANPASNPPEVFPPTRSRVVIRLAGDTRAKPTANTRTLRPDNCLVVSSLAPELRPACPRNTGANAVTTRIIYARPTVAVFGRVLPRPKGDQPESLEDEILLGCRPASHAQRGSQSNRFAPDSTSLRCATRVLPLLARCLGQNRLINLPLTSRCSRSPARSTRKQEQLQ
jgi:hypothetical protein